MTTAQKEAVENLLSRFDTMEVVPSADGDGNIVVSGNDCDGPHVLEITPAGELQFYC